MNRIAASLGPHALRLQRPPRPPLRAASWERRWRHPGRSRTRKASCPPCRASRGPRRAPAQSGPHERPAEEQHRASRSFVAIKGCVAARLTTNSLGGTRAAQGDPDSSRRAYGSNRHTLPICTNQGGVSQEHQAQGPIRMPAHLSHCNYLSKGEAQAWNRHLRHAASKPRTNPRHLPSGSARGKSRSRGSTRPPASAPPQLSHTGCAAQPLHAMCFITITRWAGRARSVTFVPFLARSSKKCTWWTVSPTFGTTFREGRPRLATNYFLCLSKPHTHT